MSLPQNWILTSLGNITNYIQRGVSPKYVDVDGIPVVNQKAIRWDGIREEFLKFLHKDQFKKISSERHIQEGDVLINSTGTGTIGRSCIVDKNELAKAKVVDSHVTIIRGNFNLVVSKYIYYWIRSSEVQETLNGLYTGTTNQIELTRSVLLDLSIPLPPLPEQKRIVTKLDKLFANHDKLKARLEKVPELLKQFRQAVLTQAVTGKLTEEWRGNKQYSESFVDDPIKQKIVGASGWSLMKFNKACRLIGGSQPPKSRFSKVQQEGYIRLIQIRDYKSDDHIVFIPKSEARRFCSKDDIMIGRYGPPIFQILRGLEGAYNVALMKAEPADPSLDRDYLFFYLQNQQLFQYVDFGSHRTAGQTGVNKEYLENYPFYLPPFEEQKEIVRRVESLFALADKIEASYNTLKEKTDHLPQAILAKAFRGDLA